MTLDVRLSGKVCAYLVKCALIWYREILSQSLKSLQPMLSQWGYRDNCKSTCNLLAEVLAGSRINFEGLAFASKAILRKKDLWLLRSVTFIYTFHWITPTFWKKTLIIPLERHYLSYIFEIPFSVGLFTNAIAMHLMVLETRRKKRKNEAQNKKKIIAVWRIARRSRSFPCLFIGVFRVNRLRWSFRGQHALFRFSLRCTEAE